MTDSYKIHVPLNDVMRFMGRYYGRHKWRVAVAYIFLTFSGIMSLLNPYTFQWLINVASKTYEEGGRDLVMILKPIAAIVACSVGYHVFLRSAHFLNCYTDSKVQADISTDISSQLHHFETDWHANHFVGSMVTAIKRGRNAAHVFYDQICYEFYPTVFIAVFMTYLMFGHSIALGIFFICFAIVFTTVSILISRFYVLPVNRLATLEDSRLGGTVADSLTGHPITKAFGAEKRESSRLKNAADSWQRAACASWLRLNVVSLVQNVVNNLGRIGSMAISAWFWYRGEFNAGDLMFVFMAQRVLSDNLDNIGNNLNKVVTAVNDMEEVVAWSNRKPEIVSRENAATISGNKGRIEFRNIEFSYATQNRLALDNFNLVIEPGEKIALVGPSGGGKSTVLKLLQRFYEPQKGEILLDGINVNEIELSSLRASMALVPQDPILFHRSLSENIGYPRPEYGFDKIAAASDAAQISDLIANLPKGYDTYVGERGIKLSGGERQRVAIARAILADTPVLLLDEATSALDSESEEKIQHGLAEAAKGRTMIAIAHRLSTIQSVDRIIVIDKGRIIEQGSHRELISKPDSLYRRLYESQAKGFIQ